jgi:uncharacterized protein (TIGR03067 family)
MMIWVVCGCLCSTLSLSHGQTTAKVSDQQEPDKVLTKEQVMEKLQGKWLPVEAKIGGNDFPAEVLKTIQLEIVKDKYIVLANNVEDRGRTEINVADKIWTMDITGEVGPNKERTIQTIFKFEDDKLIVCYEVGDGKRPEEFVSPPTSQVLLMTYKRKPKDQ